MLKILSKRKEGNYEITEYTRDGQTVSHTVKAPIPAEIPDNPQDPVEQTPTLEDKINYIYYKNMGVI